MKHTQIIAAIFALATVAGCSTDKADQLILGNIITVNEQMPVAEAMTVKDGLIQFVGTKAEAEALCDGRTEVLDYGANTVYPGFLEAHAHGAGAGIRMAGQAKLADGASVEDYVATMKEWMAAHPDKEAYVGSGWKPWVIDEPDKSVLDAICPDKPMALASIDGHSAWVNSCLMEKEHIDKEFAAKMGPAQVHVDADGNPTGILTESAAAPYQNYGESTSEDWKSYILAWQDFAFSKGFTAATEAGVELAGVDSKYAYSALGEEGKLKLRTYAYHLVADTSKTPEEDVAAALEDIKQLNNEYFKVIGMKVFIDGVVESHTAWLLEDYLDIPGYHGLERYSDHDVAVRLVEESSRNGLSVHAHTIGDGAVRFMLDAIEEAAEATGDYDQRNILVHLQYIDEPDYARFAKYGVIAGTAPLWAPKVPSNFSQECSFVGEQKAETAYPLKSVLDAGILNVSHSDYPVSTEVGIPATFYKGVMRANPGQPESVRDAFEGISRMDVLKSMTINVACLWREESRLGSLEVGKIANATVFDKDFLQAPIEDIPSAKLVATIVDGQVVYSAE